jgi:hypothetical protein
VKFEPKDPPRHFQVGVGSATTVYDCGSVDLEPNEQVTFRTGQGGEYDVRRQAWGFYATPSTNGHLPRYGLRAAMIRNAIRQYFVVLVEKGREKEFWSYLEDEKCELVSWLDETKVLDRFFASKP